MPKKAEELALIVSEKISKKKPFIRNMQEGRKKYAVYACGLTPFINVPAETHKFVGVNNGQDLNVNFGSAQFPMINGGLGVKIFPWKNICVDISLMNDLGQYITVNQKSMPSYSKNTTIYFKNSNALYNVYYIFNPENKFSYTLGGGVDKTQMQWTGIGWNTYYWLNMGNSHFETIYFTNIGIDYKLVDDVSISLSSLYLITNYNPVELDVFNGVKNILEIKPVSPLVFKLSVTCCFNF
jgi:outer membrane protein W